LDAALHAVAVAGALLFALLEHSPLTEGVRGRTVLVGAASTHLKLGVGGARGGLAEFADRAIGAITVGLADAEVEPRPREVGGVAKRPVGARIALAVRVREARLAAVLLGRVLDAMRLIGVRAGLVTLGDSAGCGTLAIANAVAVVLAQGAFGATAALAVSVLAAAPLGGRAAICGGVPAGAVLLGLPAGAVLWGLPAGAVLWGLPAGAVL